MTSYRVALFAAAFVGAAWSTVPARAEPGEIKGQDVMGDRDRSANDGWSQAPVPREQSAGKDAPDPGGNSTERNGDRPVKDAGASGGSSADPQKPLDQRAPGPSGQNPAAPSK